MIPKSSEIADQAAYSLFQGQHGLRQLILGKRISSTPANALEPSLEQRIVGRGEGQLVDGHDRKRLALHVDAFPKTSRREQHGIAELTKTG